MKFGLLNADVNTAQYAAALAAAGCELTLIHEEADGVQESFPADSPVRRVDEWEEALACGADFVLVGAVGLELRRLEQLQRLVQEGMSVLFVHPQTTATLAYFELDMHRQATNVALVPLEATRHQPAVDSLKDLGRIDEVIVEHRVRTTTRAEVLERFICDIGAIRRLTGPCDKVSAMGSLGEATTAPQAGIQITATSGALIRWSIGPTRDEPATHWRVVGGDGTADLHVDSVGDWHATITRNGVAEDRDYSQAIGVAAAAEAGLLAIGDPANELWREALADLELVEAVERSLRKGRTVELFHEEASEQGTFHGVMAAGGCLLLMLSIGTAVAATVLGKFQFAVANIWPYALLAVLAVFLLMQFLKFVFPPQDKDAANR